MKTVFMGIVKSEKPITRRLLDWWPPFFDMKSLVLVKEINEDRNGLCEDEWEQGTD